MKTRIKYLFKKPDPYVPDYVETRKKQTIEVTAEMLLCHRELFPDNAKEGDHVYVTQDIIEKIIFRKILTR